MSLLEASYTQDNNYLLPSSKLTPQRKIPIHKQGNNIHTLVSKKLLPTSPIGCFSLKHHFGMEEIPRAINEIMEIKLTKCEIMC